MRATLLKRIEALEAAAKQATARPLVLVDVTKMPEHERDAYWAGDDAVLTRHGARDGEDVEPGTIHTLVISVHEAARDAWQSTGELDDDALEAQERREEAEGRRRAAEERERAHRARIAAQTPYVPPAPANAYTPERNDDAI
jgi:hypothetical protein